MLITHPDYLDVPERLNIYRELLAHLASQPDIWHASAAEVAVWWRQRDNMEIVGESESARLIGPMAERGRVALLQDLLQDLPQDFATT